HLKSIERMTEDIVRSFEALNVSIVSLKDAFEKADEALHMPLIDEALHIHKAFINAFKKGYPLFNESLGQTINVNRDEFVKFVAEEYRSCFVEAIDFYYDCELTRKGI